MRYGFSTNAFRRFSIEEAIAAIAAAGYDGVEIMADVPHAYPPAVGEAELRSLRGALDRHGLQISNINGFMLCALGDFHHPSFIEPDPAARRQRVEHTCNCLHLAARLGCSTVSIEPGGPLPPGMDPDHAWELFCHALGHDLVPVAEALGVAILVEPEPGLLIETPEQFLQLKELVPSPAVALNFDIGHFFCAGKEPADWVARLAQYTRHYHLEDIAADRVHHHLAPGAGAIDLQATLDAIGATGYTGFVTVELYPYEDDPAGAARQAMEYLRGLPAAGRG
jgi:sugar phosphate isomerase/epimerase